MATRGVYVQVDEETGAGTAGIMHGDAADTGPTAAGLPGTVEVAGLDRRAVAGGEDERRFLPSRPCSGPVAGLLCPTQPQGSEADVRSGSTASGSRVLVSRRSSCLPIRWRCQPVVSPWLCAHMG